MCATKLSFQVSEQKRVKLTRAQQKQIEQLYKNVSNTIKQQLKKAPTGSSEVLKRQYLQRLQLQIDDLLAQIRTEMGVTIKDNMRTVAESVVSDNVKFLNEVNMPMRNPLVHVPDEVVRRVATGQLYDKDWSLSKAIWKTTNKTQKDVQEIVARGIAQNKSAYDIAVDLESYVNPTKRKEWDWSKVYPGTLRKVDYSAQRLARTMVSHAYQQSFVQTTIKNPFVTKYRWVSSGGSRVCPICAERDGQEYEKDQLPLDHPNGMCTFIAVIEDTNIQIADRIADWALGKPDKELDEFSKFLDGE